MRSLLTIAFAFSSIVLSAQTTTLKLASDVWPPFTDIESKKAFAIDLVREALARNEVKANTSILGFADVMSGIQNGKFNGSSALWFSADRAEYLLFSEPYLENRLILVGKKGSSVNAKSLSELKGKRIAVVESYAYGSLVEKSNDLNLVSGKSDQMNLERLLKDEVDYMLVDALLIEYLLTYQREEATRYLEIGSNTLIRLPLYFAIRKDTPDAESIIKGFNEEIKKMIVEGTYNRILQLNWIAMDVNGDGKTEFVLDGDKAGTDEPVNSYMVVSNESHIATNSQYVIEGIVYDSWTRVPDKYKVPKAAPTGTKYRGFGPVLKF